MIDHQEMKDFDSQVRIAFTIHTPIHSVTASCSCRRACVRHRFASSWQLHMGLVPTALRSLPALSSQLSRWYQAQLDENGHDLGGESYHDGPWPKEQGSQGLSKSNIQWQSLESGHCSRSGSHLKIKGLFELKNPENHHHH